MAQNLVYGCAANIPVTVSTSESTGIDVYVALYAEGNKISDEFKATNGKATIRVGKLEYSGNIYVGARFADAPVSKTADIPVKMLSATIWQPYCTPAEGYVIPEVAAVAIHFAENIAPSSTGYAVTIGKKPANIVKTTNNTVTVDMKDGTGLSGTLVISGVKYPELFPSYSFTFTIDFDLR